jgi:hypothetical protein
MVYLFPKMVYLFVRSHDPRAGDVPLSAIMLQAAVPTASCEIVLHGMMRDRRGLVVTDHRGERSDQH